MTARSKTNTVDKNLGSAKADATSLSPSERAKTAEPVSSPPEIEDFVAELLVTDKIILDHLAK
ncbi:hypothetical protein ASE36_02380 [Rhizobium sp. Root274]|uniref:hypothetical protein n=1 Tax=unclassified Rhizobium TaxID=2613769 RepID=UPI000713DC72|nr:MULTISPECIES: hypothetical protein [unclassified Rhizobium]KQW31150.1 hypothetical protein ASC71_02375 [Rhizobium sp. Root1240]KRD32698.1 hypothetical protein ASE36_02380 [Rhizobium sp. Root274]